MRLQAPAAIGLNPGEAVRAGAEALRRVGADLPRRLVAEADGKALVPPLGAPGEVHAVVDGIAEIDVEAELVLPVEAGIERRGGRRAERGVDRVVDEEVRFAGAGARAGVPQDAPGELAAQAGDHGRIEDVAAELRREAAGKALLEREAVRIREDPGEGGLIGPSRRDRRRGAAGGSVEDAVPRVERVADQQAPSPVGAEHGGPRVRIAEEEPALHPPAGVVGVAVGLHAAGEQVAEVAPELDVVVDGRRAPDLGGVGHRVVAGRDQQRRVVALHAAAGRGAVAVLQAQVGEAGLPERESDVAGHGIGAAVAPRRSRRCAARDCRRPDRP